MNPNVIEEPVRTKRPYTKSGRPRAPRVVKRSHRRIDTEDVADDVALECAVFRPVPFSEADKVLRALRRGPLSTSDFLATAGIDERMLERVWTQIADTGWLARLRLDGQFVYHLAAPGDSNDASGHPRQRYVKVPSVAPTYEALSFANIFGSAEVPETADRTLLLAVSSWPVSTLRTIDSLGGDGDDSIGRTGEE